MRVSRVRIPSLAQTFKNNTMILQNQIKDDMVNAMKSKNKEILGLLRVVTAEFPRCDYYRDISKDLPDNEVIKILRKMSANAKDQGNNVEVEILSEYLPEMLGETQIKTIVGGIIQTNSFSGMKDMGKVMGEIKKLTVSSQIDGKISSKIVKEMLSK